MYPPLKPSGSSQGLALKIGTHLIQRNFLSVNDAELETKEGEIKGRRKLAESLFHKSRRLSRFILPIFAAKVRNYFVT